MEILSNSSKSNRVSNTSGKVEGEDSLDGVKLDSLKLSGAEENKESVFAFGAEKNYVSEDTTSPTTPVSVAVSIK